MAAASQALKPVNGSWPGASAVAPLEVCVEDDTEVPEELDEVAVGVVEPVLDEPVLDEPQLVLDEPELEEPEPLEPLWW
jgi:hypothetical protein